MAGVEIAPRELFTNREQIRSIIEMAEQGADIDVFDRDRILRVTNFVDTTVGEAMIPIAEMTTLSRDKTTLDAIRLARQQAHFRLPVYENQHNQIIGVVSFTLWDLMDTELLQQPLEKLIQPVYFVTPHELLDELLPALQQRHDHMAIVVDEFGSAIGMITLEDVLGEIVGDVMDVGYSFETHLPRHKYSIQQLDDDSFLMDGRVPISEAAVTLKITLPETQAHTLGGMVTAYLRHIPRAGESIIQAGYRFSVLEVDEHGIQKLQVQPVS
jgi:CBS domain containing-hemolysin-like protein